MEPNRDAPLVLFPGDVLRLRKPHPCGSFEWTVVRLGADIGLTCNQCGRRILLPRREVQRRTRQFVRRGPGYQAAQALIEAQDRSALLPDAGSPDASEMAEPADRTETGSHGQ